MPQKESNTLIAFKNVAHLYMGCTVTAEIRNPDQKGTKTKTDVVFDGTMYNLLMHTGLVKIIQPKLYSLADISKEDAMYCMQQVFHPQVYYPESDYRLKLNSMGNPEIILDNSHYNEDLTFGIKTGSIWSRTRNSSGVKISFHVYEYLLQKRYDLSGLIANNIAIQLQTK